MLLSLLTLAPLMLLLLRMTMMMMTNGGDGDDNEANDWPIRFNIFWFKMIRNGIKGHSVHEEKSND